MRLLVFGSRTFTKRQIIYSALDGYLLNHLVLQAAGLDAPFVLIEGAATGADSIAGEWAEMVVGGHPLIEAPNFLHLSFPAHWGKHGKAAGPIRNKQMLEEGRPDLGLGFIDKPLVESRGSRDMYIRLRQADVETFLISSVYEHRMDP